MANKRVDPKNKKTHFSTNLSLWVINELKKYAEDNSLVISSIVEEGILSIIKK